MSEPTFDDVEVEVDPDPGEFVDEPSDPEGDDE
jgi:hypothetical protein